MIAAMPGVTMHSRTKVNAFDQAELRATNLKEPCVKRESGALHIEDTYGPGRKNVCQRKSYGDSNTAFGGYNGHAFELGVDRSC